jgi:hypothetical protein
MDPEFIKQQGDILGNLNAPMTFQQVNQGDRITAGPFDPGSGSFNGQGYDVGVDPSIADTNAKNLEAQKIARDAQIRAAQIAASSRGGGAAPQPKYDMTVNPKTGTIVYIAPNQPPFDTGIPAQSPQGQQLLAPKDIAGMYESYEKGQSNLMPEERRENPWLPILKELLPGQRGVPMGPGPVDFFGEEQAGGNQLPIQPTEIPQIPGQGNPLGGGQSLPPEVEANIAQMMKDTQQPREAVIAYLMKMGVIK